MVPSYWRNNVFRYARFDVQALCDMASELRNGHFCHCSLSQLPLHGSYNWAVFVDFDDGVQWVFRVPYDNPNIPTIIPLDVCARMIRSEVATLTYVASSTDIPVPTVFAYCPTDDNSIGVPFILMSKAKGQPLIQTWEESGNRPDVRFSIVYQLGQITWKLSQHRFDRIGSLFQEGDTFKIGECLSRGHVANGRNALDSFKRRSFKHVSSFFGNLVETLIQQASTLPLYMHCFTAPSLAQEDYKSRKHFDEARHCRLDFLALRKKLDSANNRADYVIVGNIIYDLLKQWRQVYSAVPLSKPFPLHHPDLSANNIFVDENYRITCIIDWSFCTTVALEVLFAPPGLPQTRHELNDNLTREFYRGITHSMQCPTNEDEAEIVLNAERLFTSGRFYWSLYHLLSFDSRHDFRSLKIVWEALKPSDSPSLESHFTALRRDPQFRTLYELFLAQESSNAEIAEEEDDRFKLRGKFERAIATKLHVLSDWDVQYNSPPRETRLTRRTTRARHCLRRSGDLFMADGRLWKWLMLWKEQYSRIYQ